MKNKHCQYNSGLFVHTKWTVETDNILVFSLFGKTYLSHYTTVAYAVKMIKF